MGPGAASEPVSAAADQSSGGHSSAAFGDAEPERCTGRRARCIRGAPWHVTLWACRGPTGNQNHG